MTAKFTCINCRVAFSNADIQRQHYKTDWHRYNLKRKVADLPPVSAEEFQRRVLLQREQDEASGKSESSYCKVCRKTFTSMKSLENHIKSKKHLSLVGDISPSSSPMDVISPGGAGDNQSKSNIENDLDHKTSDSEYDSDIEEVDSDEWDEEFSDDNPILQNNCLFCSHHSASMMKNVRHMTIEHSFFIPDVEYVTDMKGLLCYLGEKIIQGFMCLWCNDRGRAFHSAEAAKQHMIDKGHCKMIHEGEALLEYADYYDYSKSYPDDYIGSKDDFEELSVPVIDDEDYQLTLPSGSVIGHRSLIRYYRQNIDPNRAVVPIQRKVHRVIAQYRALGWTESDKHAVAKKARDLKFMRHVQSKHYMKLGVKANNLSTKRPQVNF